MSFKFKAPFEDVHEKGEAGSPFEDVIHYDDEYYSKYVHENLKNAEVLKMTDFVEESNNPPKLEDLTDLEAVEYYVDLLVYADVNFTKEQVFEQLVDAIENKKYNMDVGCEAICQVGNSHYISLPFYSFYDQQFYDDTLRYIVIYSIETAIEPNLINESLEVARTKVLDLIESKKAKYVTIYECEMDEAFNEFFDSSEHITYIGFNFQERHQIKKLTPEQVYQKCIELLHNKDTELYGNFINNNNTHIGFLNEKS